METWRAVSGFPRYEVSDFGRVRNVETGRQLKPDEHRARYLAVRLYGPRGVKHCLIHRLVAEAFLPSPDVDKPLVLHRNGKRTDNAVSNLYWGDWSDNTYDSITARTHSNALREACPRGHPYVEGNLYQYFDSKGRRHRQCLICKREAKARFDSKRRAKKE